MPAATLRCPIAETVALWVQNDLGPAMAEFESPPTAVTNHGSYDCRGRNNHAGAKISEHGRGNALDLGPIKLANGSVVDLTKRSIPQPFRQRLRDATCRRFNTVLGPGSDAYHADHIHVDLAERAHGYQHHPRGLQPTMVAAGVVDAKGKAKYTGLHSLRHFYASWCINRRIDGGARAPAQGGASAARSRLDPNDGRPLRAPVSTW
jgi:hypothetical protein